MPLRVFSIVLAIAVLVRSAATPAQERPTFSAQSELVVLHVTVEDRRGAYVRGLEQEAFTVLEDGKPQAVKFFSAADTPATIGLLIDNSYSMMNRRELVVAAAVGFTERSNPEDEVFVLAFNENVGEIWAPKVIRDTNLHLHEGGAPRPHRRAREDRAVRRDCRRVESPERGQAHASGAGDRQRRQRQRQRHDARRSLDPDPFRRSGDLHGDPARSDRSRWQRRPAQASGTRDRWRGVRAGGNGRCAEDARAHRSRHSQRLHDQLRARQAATVRRCAS